LSSSIKPALSLPLTVPDSKHKAWPSEHASLPGPCPNPRRILQQLTPLRRGTGYIGSFTALALLEAGYKVVITDNLYNSSEEVLNRIELICGKRPDFVRLDVKDEEAFDDVFSKHPDIDSVIHFAALKVRLVAGNTTRPKTTIATTMSIGKVIHADPLH
jgi:UDP-glucose 4-epimerase